jgi:hypothetical protein
MITKHSSLPDAAALKRHLAMVARATDRIAAEREQMNFGGRIKSAVQARLRLRSAAAVAPSTQARAEHDSFGSRIAQAVERKRGKLPTQKQHEQEAARDRSRYQRLRRQTKGE